VAKIRGTYPKIHKNQMVGSSGSGGCGGGGTFWSDQSEQHEKISIKYTNIYIGIRE
jgi:hypothetical protein